MISRYRAVGTRQGRSGSVEGAVERQLHTLADPQVLADERAGRLRL
jgi:hypothetical protein